MKKVLLFSLAALFAITGYAQDTLSIDSVQWVSQANLANCDDMSRYDGDTVVISGICLVDGDAYGSTSHNIQIAQSGTMVPFGGIRFRQGDPNAVYNVNIRTLKQGDSIIAIGTMSQYQGETQFEPLETNSSIKILSRNVVVTPAVVNVADLNDNARNNNLTDGEKWESSLVTITDLEVKSVDFFSGNSRVSFVVGDANGNLINVGDHFTAQKLPQYTHPVTGNPGTFQPPSVGDKFDSITGVIIHSLNNCPGATGRGYEIHPYDQSLYVYGPSAPRVENTRRDLAAPTSSQSVKVSAEVYDLDGQLTRVELNWATGTDPTQPGFTKVTMTNTSGNTYEGTIPANSDGTFVRYFIQAEDDSSNVTTLPNSDPTQGTYSYRVRDNGLRIYDVQFTPFADGNSPFMGQDVTITGVVTSGGKDMDLPLIHIQDKNESGKAWSGIELTNAGQTFDRGTEIEVEGTVQENFGKTAISVSRISNVGTGSIDAHYTAPETFNSPYSFADHEKWESVLVGLVNTTGTNKVHVVDTNADASSNNNFAEYRVGSDPFDPNSGCRVLAGREGVSSIWVPYVNESFRIKDPYPITKIIVNDTMNMDTLHGIITYSFSNMKMLPRNAEDFINMNSAPADTTDPGDTTSVESISKIESEFKVYPNPAEEVVHLVNESQERIIKIKLIDAEGRTVFERHTSLIENAIFLDSFDAGLYLIQIESQNGQLLDRKKLIVQ